ncbi:MAG: 4Fe-4S binding protein [Candidatus Omnitrophica bacterium]|nr:4Fe-4S binding protein [Candidatus Omnitrophota bacterium]
MPKIKINIQRCKGCLLCADFCPKKLITPTLKINKKGFNFVEFKDKEQSCIGCCFCAIMCPETCIEVYR